MKKQYWFMWGVLKISWGIFNQIYMCCWSVSETDMLRWPLATADTYKVIPISQTRQSTTYIGEIFEVKCQYYDSHRYVTNDCILSIILLRNFYRYTYCTWHGAHEPLIRDPVSFVILIIINVGTQNTIRFEWFIWYIWEYVVIFIENKWK
jgi:hypothetical protein